MCDTNEYELHLSEDIRQELYEREIHVDQDLQRDHPGLAIRYGKSQLIGADGSRDIVTIITVTTALVASVSPIIVEFIKRQWPKVELVVTEETQADGRTIVRIHRKES